MFKQLLQRVLPAAYDTKMVIIVRTDLNMERGKIAAQCAHAAVVSYQQALNSGPKHSQLARTWFQSGQPKIVLKVPSETSLQELHRAALANNLNAALIHDAGHTQVKHGTLTVLGVGPACKAHVDQVTGHLKLY